jgi:hypothetical protein
MMEVDEPGRRDGEGIGGVGVVETVRPFGLHHDCAGDARGVQGVQQLFGRHRMIVEPIEPRQPFGGRQRVLGVVSTHDVGMGVDDRGPVHGPTLLRLPSAMSCQN